MITEQYSGDYDYHLQTPPDAAYAASASIEY